MEHLYLGRSQGNEPTTSRCEGHHLAIIGLMFRDGDLDRLYGGGLGDLCLTCAVTLLEGGGEWGGEGGVGGG